VQYIGHTHSILSLVGAGLGLAVVPSSAQRMQFTNVRYRHIDLGAEIAAELHLTWKRDHDNPAAQQVREHLLPGRASRSG
jgi:DNA-binding transcriptional LysR family regulator